MLAFRAKQFKTDLTDIFMLGEIMEGGPRARSRYGDWLGLDGPVFDRRFSLLHNRGDGFRSPLSLLYNGSRAYFRGPGPGPSVDNPTHIYRRG